MAISAPSRSPPITTSPIFPAAIPPSIIGLKHARSPITGEASRPSWWCTRRGGSSAIMGSRRPQWCRRACRARSAPASRPIRLPCLLLGQLATDARWAGRGIGTGLVKHALQRCVEAARLIGGRALMVNAVDEGAAAFWRRRGFLARRTIRSSCFVHCRISRPRSPRPQDTLKRHEARAVARAPWQSHLLSLTRRRGERSLRASGCRTSRRRFPGPRPGVGTAGSSC